MKIAATLPPTYLKRPVYGQFGVVADEWQVAAKCDSIINFCISIENTVKFAYSLKRKPLVVEGVSRYDSYVQFVLVRCRV